MATTTTTIFIALQCCQCSTMQVKQQKKSSNKWTCVVCNQKQSVRKVFARGLMARDVRKFVQSFNMSRLSSDLETLDPPLEGGGEGAVGDRTGSGDWRKLKRSDWSEYLDIEREMHAEEEDEGGMKIVTELPREILKKPKLKDHSCQSDGLKGDKLFKPSFTVRNIRKQTSFPDEEPKKNQNELAFRTSSWTNSKRENGIDPVISQSTAAARSTTKWSNYMSQDEDTLQVGMYKDDVDRFSSGVLESKTNDQKVEEDIHPDFM